MITSALRHSIVVGVSLAALGCAHPSAEEESQPNTDSTLTEQTAAATRAPASTCPTGAVFCDDFESAANNAAPSGKWKSWTTGGAQVLVDSTRHFSGSKSVHFHGAVSLNTRAFMLAQGAPAFPVSGKTLYLRFMIYGTRFPFTGLSAPNHTAFAWIGSTKALNAPGQQFANQGYLLADYNGVAAEPMWTGFYRDTTRHFKDANQSNAWHCWEMEVDNEHGPPVGAGGVALPHIWEDGVELKLSVAGTNTQYAAVPFEAIMFSLWSPQTDSVAADYWIDDVAVSKTRINCPR